MACNCDQNTCAFRENGGTCATCKVKAKYVEEGKCNCPFQFKKERFEKWIARQSPKENTEPKACSCGG